MVGARCSSLEGEEGRYGGGRCNSWEGQVVPGGRRGTIVGEGLWRGGMRSTHAVRFRGSSRQYSVGVCRAPTQCGLEAVASSIGGGDAKNPHSEGGPTSCGCRLSGCRASLDHPHNLPIKHQAEAPTPLPQPRSWSQPPYPSLLRSRSCSSAWLPQVPPQRLSWRPCVCSAGRPRQHSVCHSNSRGWTGRRWNARLRPWRSCRTWTPWSHTGLHTPSPTGP